MNRNVRIAKQLLKIARSLVATDNTAEQQLKDFNSKCFDEFVKKISANGTTVNGEYADKTTINGKDVEVQMHTFSKNGKAEFKYVVKIGGNSFEETVEADVKVPFKGDSTYDFRLESDEDAKKFIDEYVDSLTTSVGIAKGIDDAFEQAVEKLSE